MKINVIILNYFSANEVQACLENLNGNGGAMFRVVVVNNSDDNLYEKVIKDKSFKFELHYLVNSQNFGYAHGNNTGYNFLKDKDFSGNVLIINPDVSIKNDDILKLNDVLKIHDVGMVMPSAHDENQKLLYTNLYFKNFNQKWIVNTPNNNSLKEATINTDYVAGSCFMIKWELVKSIGLFDERFFMYWEEVDLSMRVIRNRFKLLSLPDVRIMRASNDINRIIKANFYLVRNSFLLFSKNRNEINIKGLIKYNFLMFFKSIYLSLKIRKLKPITLNIDAIYSGLKFL